MLRRSGLWRIARECDWDGTGTEVIAVELKEQAVCVEGRGGLVEVER